MGRSRIYIIKIRIIGPEVRSGTANQETVVKFHICFGGLVEFNVQRRSRIRARTSNSFKRVVFRNFLVRGQVQANLGRIKRNIPKIT